MLRGSRIAWACTALVWLAVGCALDGDAQPVQPAQPTQPVTTAADAAPPADGDSSAAAGCEQRTPSVDVSPARADSVAAGTAVQYTLHITNNNQGSCPPEKFIASVTLPSGQPTFQANPSAAAAPPLAAGESADVRLAVSSGSQEEPADYELGFFVRSTAAAAELEILTAQRKSSYRVAEPAGCFVAPSRGLLVRHPSVVDDPERTTGRGAWTLGKLIEQLAPSSDAAPALLEAMLQSYMREQTINGFKVAARPAIDALVLAKWPRTEQGQLDLSRTPARLLAIAHRLDLPDLAAGRAGEGRFIFDLLQPTGEPLLFTLILEYALPAKTAEEQQVWAERVHALQGAPFPSAAYNDSLQALTDLYTRPQLVADRPQGSALLRIRSNENALDPAGQWEMREFHLADDGALVPAALQQTPHSMWNGTPKLARFIDDNRQAILSEHYDVPEQLDGSPFQAGSVINRLDHWSADGIQDDDARHTFSQNTCDGCHGGETFTSFFHVFPRSAGQQSQLSRFLTGISDRDPVSRAERSYHELARRGALLRAAVCPD